MQGGGGGRYRDMSEYLLPEEVRTKLARIMASSEDMKRINRLARSEVAKFRLRETAEDLIHMLIERCLDDRRHWPRHMSVGQFFHRNLRWMALDIIESRPQLDELDEQLPSTQVGFDQKLAEKLAFERLERDLSRDPNAVSVLKAILEGCTGLEIQLRTGLTENQVAAAKKAISRQIPKSFRKDS
jgi:DNA-directed RNA polymerase specialized sigma24 family protein